jgi:N4-gp56 family major capsid protein
VEITDMIADTHEDPILQEAVRLCGEQAAETLELARIAILKAGTTVFYANGTARNQVNSFTNRGQLRKVVRYLKGQKAKFFTQVVKAAPAYATDPVGPCFWAMGHTDLEADIRSIAGFVPIEQYADSDKAVEGEVGKVENIRFVLTPLFAPWEDAGGSADSTRISTGGSQCDVYPLIIAARDAYAVVPLKGEHAVIPRVVNPEHPSKSDPLGQRGYVSWKTYHSSVILNDNWLARIEVAASLNPS